MKIWNENGIMPGHSVVGSRSKKYIYCTPVSIFDDGCPSGSRHMYGNLYKDLIDVQIVIDFEMVMKDKLDCYYTQDGQVAISCELLGNAYIKQAFDLKSGHVWYTRQFALTDELHEETIPAVDPADT